MVAYQKEGSRDEICRCLTTVAETEDRWKSRRRYTEDGHLWRKVTHCNFGVGSRGWLSVEA
ncbi:hypothetical protein CsSME_00018074 [Camellia sinensis var. sinensis]